MLALGLHTSRIPRQGHRSFWLIGNNYEFTLLLFIFGQTFLKNYHHHLSKKYVFSNLNEARPRRWQLCHVEWFHFRRRKRWCFATETMPRKMFTPINNYSLVPDFEQSKKLFRSKIFLKYLCPRIDRSTQCHSVPASAHKLSCFERMFTLRRLRFYFPMNHQLGIFVVFRCIYLI